MIVPAHRVHGHLDYRRAAEALKAAERAAERVPSIADVVMSAETVRLAMKNVEAARRRVAEVEAELRRSLFDDDAPRRARPHSAAVLHAALAGDDSRRKRRTRSMNWAVVFGIGTRARVT